MHAMGIYKLPYLLEIPIVIRSYKHKEITPRLPKLKDRKKTPRYTRFSEDEENEETASVIRPERSPKATFHRPCHCSRSKGGHPA